MNTTVSEGLPPPPTEPRDPPELRRFAMRLVAVVLALDLFVGAVVAAVVVSGRSQHRAQAEDMAATLASGLEASIAGALGRLDLTLQAVADEIRRQRLAGGEDASLMEEVLRRHEARLPEILGLRVVDADGIIRHAVSGIKAPQASLADHPHFSRMRAASHGGLVISQPTFGRAAKVWLLSIGRRLDNPDGSFGGVVLAALPVDRLRDMLTTAQVGANGSVSLWDGSQTQVARVPVPADPNSIYTSPPAPSAELQALIAANTTDATFMGRSSTDRVMRVHGLRRIGQLPLWINVGVAEEDYLAEWNRQSAFLVAAAILFMVVSAVIGLLLLRSWRARHRSTLDLAEAHAQAEEARRRLELIVGSAGEGICGVDPGGRIIFINATARRMLGWGAEEGIGLNLHDEVHHHRADGSPFPPVACPVSQTLHDGNVRHIPRDVHWRRDGTSIPVEFTVAPIVQNGRITGAVTLFRDITRRVRAEAEASRNLAMTTAIGAILRHALEDRPLAAILHDALVEILILPWLNLEERGCVFLTLPGGERLEMVASHNLEPSTAMACASIASGHCLCGTAALRREVLFTSHVDDRHVPLADGVRDHGHYIVPIVDGNELLGVLNAQVASGHSWQKEEEQFLRMAADTLAGVIRRKQVEQRLRDSEELSSTLINATMDGALLLTPEGRVLAANAALAGRFGIAPEEMAGRDFFAMLPPALAESRRKHLEQVMADRTPGHLHDERDGKVLDNRVYPIIDARGTVRSVAVFSRDVTEQRIAARTIEKAMADLARSNAELEQFAYVASHDLREPLRAITGHLQLLQRVLKERLDQEAAEILLFAVDGARRMDALIRDLLDYSRIGHVNREMEHLDLAAIVADAQANLAAAIADSGARIEVLASLPLVHGNRIELIRLFQNLMGNAIKYRDPERAPVVTLTATRAGGNWEIAITDNGIGIDKDYFERIFMIFQRLHGHGQYEGTGIGLAVCRKIAERHGGAIAVRSQPGQGSTFTITLPAIQD